jgi:DNA mismatch repair protein MutS2
MIFFPASAPVQLEFDKIKLLLADRCQGENAKKNARELRIHTRKEFIEPQLRQTHEFKLLLQNNIVFAADVFNLSKELKLLSIEGAVLRGEDFLGLKKLAENIRQVIRWFDNDRKLAYQSLFSVINETHFEKAIVDIINEVLDEKGNVKDNASAELADIRSSLYKKRNEHRHLFEKIVNRLNKLGYLADIEESFINGRRVLAVFAEQKRMVKGILHGESDSRRTSYIEPGETTELNNQIFSLENNENREILRILKLLTSKLRKYSSLLDTYHNILGEYDLIKAKAKLAMDIGGNMPTLLEKGRLKLIDAFHPLLLLYNKQQNKPVIPVSISLDEHNRILVISGPNAGGKTVTLKTVGLLQIMIQSGLLIPCSPDSELGIFKQLFIHIGDTQSLEFELSTYSSHLQNMKYFMENANGKTLFFIDELGSGSDPNLGGAFAEVIMEELAKKHSFGIVTTHYLNLKVMANKVRGIINGAMAFDEKNLKPLYKLIPGKPGSSYTFSIAERIGMHPSLINKAKQLVDEDHFSLDKLLNRTEQDLDKMDKERKKLADLIGENEKMKKQMEQLMNKEQHRQQVELLKHQHKVSEEKMAYLKDLERRMKALMVEWRKSEDKNQVMKNINSLLFKQRDKQVAEKQQKKIDLKFEETGGEVAVGNKVKMRSNKQVGIVKAIRSKKAIVQVGIVPFTVDLTDLIPVKERVEKEP